MISSRTSIRAALTPEVSLVEDDHVIETLSAPVVVLGVSQWTLLLDSEVDPILWTKMGGS